MSQGHQPLAVEGQIEGSLRRARLRAPPRRWSGWPAAREPDHDGLQGAARRRRSHEINSIIVEAEDPDGPFGAKDAASSASTPSRRAIANAVTAATGKRFNALPLKPERVLRGLMGN